MADIDEYHPFLQFLWLLYLFELTQAQIEVKTLLEFPLEPCRLLVLVHKTLLGRPQGQGQALYPTVYR